MEKLEKVQMLNTFLAKVKLLRGYGDMNSYSLANQFKTIGDSAQLALPTQKVDEIITDLSSPTTWNEGKNMFINNIENLLNDILSD